MIGSSVIGVLKQLPQRAEVGRVSREDFVHEVAAVRGRRVVLDVEREAPARWMSDSSSSRRSSLAWAAQSGGGGGVRRYRCSILILKKD